MANESRGLQDGLFSRHVERALQASLAAHAGQLRKGEPTPYVAHPVHVALILAQAGADDVVLQAALLHDVVEDCEGWTLARIEAEFGSAVAEIVGDLTEQEQGSWEVRKEAALDRVAHMNLGALAVKAADKLHNMHSVLARLEVESDPDVVWRVFSRGAGPSIAYAKRLSAALMARLQGTGQFEALGLELERAIEELSRYLPADSAD